nr:hypothetical protein BDOA9_0156190 [Bradyrhizobium sp. DOA9]
MRNSLSLRSNFTISSCAASSSGFRLIVSCCVSLLVMTRDPQKLRSHLHRRPETAKRFGAAGLRKHDGAPVARR